MISLKSPIFYSLVLMFLLSCSMERAPLGTEKNPIKIYFTPSVEAKKIEDHSKTIKKYLEVNTPYKYKVASPTSYIAVIEAFGTKRADVAALNTFGYILAQEKYGVEARIIFLRYGSDTYKAQIITKNDNKINSMKDLDKKKFAFVDPSSTSGYLLPLKMFKDAGIAPSETVFASRHDNVVTMIYQGQVDAGATFYSPPEKGKIQDARRLVKTQYPDVEEKIKILQLSEPIPNDPIVFRKDVPEEMKSTIINTLEKFIKTKDGKDAFYAIYGATNFRKASDKDYDVVRKMLKTIGKSAESLVK